MTSGVTELVDLGSFFLIEGLVCFLGAVQRMVVLHRIDFAHSGMITVWGVALDGAIPFLESYKPDIVVSVIATEFFVIAEEFHEL